MAALDRGNISNCFCNRVFNLNQTKQMKKSVNGKSFDEIFGQRGRGIRTKEIKAGAVVLNVYEFTFTDFIWISIERRIKIRNGLIYTGECLYEDGQYMKTNFYTLNSEFKFYEATPDQIALLNAYKYEQNG